jgi:hypothetical protein
MNWMNSSTIYYNDPLTPSKYNKVNALAKEGGYLYALFDDASHILRRRAVHRQMQWWEGSRSIWGRDLHMPC